MNLESILQKIYGSGAYHVLLALLCGLNSVVIMFDLQLNNFMLYEPTEILCDTAEPVDWITKSAYENLLRNISIDLKKVHSTKECYGVLAKDRKTPYHCKKWLYPRDVMKNNILMEHNLICDKHFIKTGLWFDYMLGAPIGFIIAMQADRFGRQRMFFILLAVQTVVNILIPLMSNIVLLFITMFIRSLTGCLVFLAATQITELLPINKRATFLYLYSFGWCLGNTICPLAVYGIRDWRHTKYFVLILSSTNLILFYLFPKSPRLTFLKGDYTEAIKVIKRIIKFNKPDIPEDFVDDLAKNADAIRSQISKNICNESILDGFKNKAVRNRILLCAFCHATITFSYYGILSRVDFLSKNIYKSVFLMGLVEFPGTALPWLFSDKVGRRSTSIALRLVSSVMIIVTPFLNIEPNLKVIFGMIGKATLSAAYAVADLYIVELMPTSIRSGGIFFTMMVGSLASTASPLANAILPTYVIVTLYGVGIAVGAVLLFFYFPETKDYPLPETIEECEALLPWKESEWAYTKMQQV